MLGVAICTAGAALYHAQKTGHLKGRRLDLCAVCRRSKPKLVRTVMLPGTPSCTSLPSGTGVLRTATTVLPLRPGGSSPVAASSCPCTKSLAGADHAGCRLCFPPARSEPLPTPDMGSLHSHTAAAFDGVGGVDAAGTPTRLNGAIRQSSVQDLDLHRVTVCSG